MVKGPTPVGAVSHGALPDSPKRADGRPTGRSGNRSLSPPPPIRLVWEGEGEGRRVWDSLSPEGGEGSPGPLHPSLPYEGNPRGG